jgi:glycosyltransferase involved in cell wall biosynthesis
MAIEEARLLSVVVIGLNEQDRLKQSLEAIFACRPEGFELEVIYVDSGSTDRSVEIANSVRGVQVLHLESGPRSAAKARNVGLRRARGSYVQLVDGDSVIQSGWLSIALSTLQQRPEVSCVFGQCIEMYPDQSIYMKVCGLDWYVAAGEYRYCGGNSMWRMSVIAGHGFFDEKMKLGEEPELCYRVRQDGGKIVCIDVPMVTHDLGMRTFEQYWKRAENSGKGYAKLAVRYWRNREKLWLREVLMNFGELLAWPILFAIGSYAGGLLGGAALLAAWYATRAAQISYALMRRRRLSISQALLYGFHSQFVRLPVVIGQFKTLAGIR